MDFDPRDRNSDSHDVEMPWVEVGKDLEHGGVAGDSRSLDEDARDRDRGERDREVDPRDVFARDLELARGPEREIVLDGDDRYELNGDDVRTLATVGAFRVVAERDLRES